MRALRSRTVQSDSGSDDKKPQRKSKKNTKRKSESQLLSSTENITLEEQEPPKKITRKSLRHKENVSPDKIETKRTSRSKNKNRKSRRNKSKDILTDDSQNNTTLETTFKNVVTSTTLKPKKPKKSYDSETTKNDVLNSTFLKVDDEPVTTNNSGQWKIEETKNSVINISDDSLKISPIDRKKVLFDETLTKSTRKKWQRFARNSQGANSVLEQICTPRKKSPINSTKKSTNKIKRTVMPNFALIHQKAFDKMESISDYSQRKKDRALLLTSSKKQPVENISTNKGSNIKSSRQLFSNEKLGNTNRFGFKLTAPVNTNSIIKPMVKTSIYERNDLVAVANKKQPLINKRDNKRDALKGVRTNRRFELLMKMRNAK